MLACYMDESSDSEQQKVYVAAGYLGQSEVWFEAERQWQARLDRDGIAYYKSSDCFSFRNEFAKLLRNHGQEARAIRDELVEDLKTILKSFDLLGFCFLGKLPDYKTVASELIANMSLPKTLTYRPTSI